MGVRAGLVGVLVLLAACGEGRRNRGEPFEPASVRVVNVSVDAPALDFYFGGSTETILTAVAFGQASPWVAVGTRELTIEVRPAGATPDSPPLFAEGPFAIPEAARATVFAQGLVGSRRGSDRFRLVPLAENFELPGPGEARVRFLNTRPDLPLVLLDVGARGSFEVGPLGPFGESGEAGIALPAGDAQILRLLDTSGTLGHVGLPPLEADARLFAAIVGDPNALPWQDGALSLLLFDAEGRVGRSTQVSFVTLVNASAEPVDLFAGDFECAGGVEPGGIASFPIPPGTALFDLFEHSAGALRPASAPEASTRLEITAGERHVLAVAGSQGVGLRVASLVDGFQREGLGPRIRALNLVPDLPTAEVAESVDGALRALDDCSALAFLDASSPLGAAIELGARTLVLRRPGAPPAAHFSIAAGEQMRAFAFFAGKVAPGPGDPPLELLLVDATGWPWTTTSVPNKE